MAEKMANERVIRVFVEKADENAVKQCLSLIKRRNEFKDVFWTEKCYDEYGNLIVGNKEYLDNIEYYLNLLVENNFQLNVGYNTSKNDTEQLGRLYARGFKLSQQGLIKTVKNYITRDLYYDYDIVNCIPTLLLEYIIKNEIDCSFVYLKNYVEKRQEILNDNQLDKINIIVSINRDNNYRTGNHWLDKFNKELKVIKNKIIEEMDLHLPEGKNNKSRAIVKELKKEERIIVDELIEFIGKDNIALPMYDGVNSYVKCDIDKFSTTLKEKYNYNYIKLIEKPIESIDELDIKVDEEIEYPSYDIVKEEWEKNIFRVINPFTYWRIYDGKTFQISKTDAMDYAKEFMYSVIENKQLKIKCIWDKWLEDKNKREYDSIDFIPFSSPQYEIKDNVFNLATPYKVHAFNNKEIVNIDNFKILINNLAEYNDEKIDYLTQLLGYKLKYPQQKANILMMMIGHTGTGKSTLWDILGKIMYDGAISYVNDLQDIVGNSCSKFMLKSCVVITEEVDFTNMKSHINKMKDVCTNDKINIKEKYEKPIDIINTKLFVINSQHDLYIENNCRRTVLYEPSAEIKKELSEENEKFWEQLYKDMNNENWLHSVYKYLIDSLRDDYTPQKDRTKVLDDSIKEQKEYSLPPALRFILDITGDDELDVTQTLGRNYFNVMYKDGMINVIHLKEAWNEYFGKKDNMPSFNVLPQIIRKYKNSYERISNKSNGKRTTYYKFNPKEFNKTIRTILKL